jgi:VanZ family protein
MCSSAVPPRRPPTRLPQYLAALYALMIVYASLGPFSGWIAPLPDTPFFLLEPSPPRFTRFDVAINVLAYAPFGFLLALIGPRRPATRLAIAIGVGALLSLAMESTQMFLPPRDASSIDLLSNSVGATAGGVAALAFHRARRFRECVAQCRYRVFLGGQIGDFGLALLAVWLVSQLNPGIPLFAATFDPSLELTRDLAGTLLQAAQSAFNVVGVGLFLALLLRQRRHLGGTVLALIGLAFVLKVIAAMLRGNPGSSPAFRQVSPPAR